MTTLSAIAVAVYHATLILVLSSLWYVPLALNLSLAERKSRSRLGWLVAAAAASPLGWTAAGDMENIRGWMIPLSVMAPLLCALLLKVLPRGSNDKPWTKAEGLWLRTLILGYALWSARGAGIYTLNSWAANRNSRTAINDLGAIRSALSAYFGDTHGSYPKQLSDLTPKYLTKLPPLRERLYGKFIHAETRRTTNFRALQPDDQNGWGYINQPQLPDGRPNPQYGSVFINCTHTDARHPKRLSDY